MKTKKFLSIILAVIMIFSFVNVVFAADTEGNIVILYTNDVHCAIDDYAILAAYRAEKIAEGTHIRFVVMKEKFQTRCDAKLQK